MKAKSFYKNNKHNNMDPKEKENINEEELKRPMQRLKTRKTSICVSPPSSTTTVNVQ